MKIMIDTNIVIDVLLDREPFAEASSAVLKLCEERHFDAFVSASAITDIFYLVRKHTSSIEQAYAAIETLLRVVDVCAVTANEVTAALKLHKNDFEDCIVAECAKSAKCECVVTRNKKDFDGLGIEMLTPTELLQR